MELNHIINEFHLTEAERDNLIKHADTKEEYIPESFKIVVQAILSGHFEVYSGNEIIRKVYPATVEIYYHEEDTKTEKMPENLKDYIVYHRNRPNEDLDLFKPGALNAHQSGIDITFEHEGIKKNKVRASALIRGFQIEENGVIGNEDTRCTYLYDALFTDVPMINNGYSLRWIDGEEKPMNKIKADKRINVKQYHHKDSSCEENATQSKTYDEVVKNDKEPDTRLRRFYIK